MWLCHILKQQQELCLQYSKTNNIHFVLLSSSNPKYELIHCLGLGYETVVCTVCLSIFLCLTSKGNICIIINIVPYQPSKLVNSQQSVLHNMHTINMYCVTNQ